jgi:ADP-heptose:LPS heptosyltransferase
VRVSKNAAGSRKIYQPDKTHPTKHSTQTIYIAGGPDEKEYLHVICNAAPSTCYKPTGQTTLPQLNSKMVSAMLVIGNDSSAIHMAVAVGTFGLHYGRGAF